MRMTMIRTLYTPISTEGVLILNMKQFCNTLERVVRKQGSPKIVGQTAIPAGRYNMTVEWWPEFKIFKPMLHDVPGFTGILLHNGASSNDSAGCILIEYNLTSDHEGYGNASIDLTAMMQARDTATNHQEIHTIEIFDSYPYWGVDGNVTPPVPNPLVIPH